MAYAAFESNAVKIITNELVREAETVECNRALQAGYHVDNLRDGQRGSVMEANYTSANTDTIMKTFASNDYNCCGWFNHNAGGYTIRLSTWNGFVYTNFLDTTCPDGDFIVLFPTKSAFGFRLRALVITDLRVGQFQVGTLSMFTYGVARPFAGIHSSNSVIASTPAHIHHRENRGRQYENWDIPMPSLQSGTRTVWSDLWDEKNAGLHAAGVAFDEGTEVSANHFVYEDVILATIANNPYSEDERWKDTLWASRMKLHEVV